MRFLGARLRYWYTLGATIGLYIGHTTPAWWGHTMFGFHVGLVTA